MATFFDGLKRSFKDVPVTADGKIETSEFLEAAESLVTLFDVLGSSAFLVVQNDMNGNIKVSWRLAIGNGPGSNSLFRKSKSTFLPTPSREPLCRTLCWLKRT